MRWLLLALLPALLPAGGAHLAVRSSVPARGDTVRVALDSVRITFTQRIELRYTAIVLLGTRGDSIRGELTAAGDGGRSVRLRLAQPLNDDRYTVAWRTAGADGHLVNGAFDFVVSGVAVRSVDDTSSTLPLRADSARIRDANLRPYAVALRWLNFALLLLIIGGAAFVLLLQRRSAHLDAGFAAASGATARRVALIACVLSILLALPRLGLQSALLNGVANSWNPAAVLALLRETNWGRGWTLQLLGALGFLFSALAAEQPRSGAWKLAAASVLVMAFGPAFSGHAAAIENLRIISISADALHLVAASVWLGTLVHLLLAAVPAALRRGAHGDLAVLIRAFSPLALVAAAATALTGSVSALAHLGSISDVWNTDYGRALGFKLLAVALTAATGFYNWRFVQPALGTDTATARLRRSATAETLIALLVLLITAVLVALPTP